MSIKKLKKIFSLMFNIQIASIQRILCTLMLIAFVASSIEVTSQVSQGGKPNWNVNEESIPALRMPAIDREALETQDAITDQYKEAPWRFGVEFDVDIDLQSEGVWTEEFNVRVWRLRIDASDALGLSFFLRRVSSSKRRRIVYLER
jgi:hypothetical protein